MTAKLLDGKALAAKLQINLQAQVAQFQAQSGITPCLAAVLVGENQASEVYVRNKRQACERVGMASQLHRLPASASQQELLSLVDRLNAAPANEPVHGILVQLPLPKQIDEKAILDAVHPLKDVDAFHPENVGLLVQGRPRFLPCTPHGIQKLLMHNSVETAGQHVVVLGRSEIVGKPISLMLVQRGPGADATVTMCHSRTQNLAKITRQADILIAAIGQPRFVKAEMIRPGAVVIDVGVNRVEGKLCGDVDFDAVREVAGAITPVPGGVGPLTIAMLLENTLKAARLQASAN
ncbi:MAG TPA: bifunctional methylenetetrahydrofolate dehydrogenase/methenyltetrahydrofolate cyclohydrolase FolD [Pirellulales bacterium]|jgi:methylenetetrahydrofolate dehydrogenase (NADP+)/methenyltetrahydrofolate cyclohydrolase|nr:bifunctional methylenetetrahydrofolate dehydrogenase/methenyltetrahydrofolate cyclohydrolase FolD [Pirellulales bacterium]